MIKFELILDDFCNQYYLINYKFRTYSK